MMDHHDHPEKSSFRQMQKIAANEAKHPNTNREGSRLSLLPLKYTSTVALYVVLGPSLGFNSLQSWRITCHQLSGLDFDNKKG